MKKIHYWTDWHCKCCCKVTGRHFFENKANPPSINHHRLHQNPPLLAYKVHHLTPHFLSSLRSFCFLVVTGVPIVFFLWPLWHCFLSSLKTCLSKNVVNMHSSENTYMRGEKMGSLQIRQHSTGLPSCLWESGLQSACQLVRLSHCIFLKHHTKLYPSVNNTTNITTGNSRTHIRFVTLFQF